MELKSPVLLSLNQLLTSLGFKKSGSKFTRALNDVIHFVELQSSQSNTSSLAKFTVNLGVLAPVLLDDDSTEFKNPSWSLCHWRQRLGHISPERRDIWWSVSDSQSSEAVAQEILYRIKEFGIPALNSLSSTTALAMLWRTGQGPGLTEYERNNLLSRLSEVENG